MDDETVGQFISITDSSAERAQQYLGLTDGNIEQAIELFFANDGVDLGVATSTSPAQTSYAPPIPPPQTPAAFSRQGYQDASGIVHIDSDEENSDDEPQLIEPRRMTGNQRAANYVSASNTPPIPQLNPRLDDDEAMARRLQEELYAGGDMSGAVDMDGVRAPIARTRETLVGPGGYDVEDEDERNAAVLEQLRARHRGPGRAGIFNQQPTTDIWSEPGSRSSSTGHRVRLAQATAGASEASPKSNHLASLYRPPFDIMSRLSWEEARAEGKANEKWILVNIQDPAIFDCQVLNRDIWSNEGIRDTVKENFIFMQYAKDDPRGNRYIQYYFQARENQDAYPHIAIVDPRTGEQVKVWSGPPVPKAPDFLMQLHEFLDRYSLNVSAKNPVARRKAEPKKEKQVEKMTEDEMMEMALQNSLAGNSGLRKDDPDDLTRSTGEFGNGKGKSNEEDADMTDSEGSRTNGHPMPIDSAGSPFSSISSTNVHAEPSPDSASTRIQFRHPNGRVVRRFALTDSVRRIYEWLKTSPLDGKQGTEFELIFMQKNLIDMLEDSIEQAGLKNGTVMVEFIEQE